MKIVSRILSLVVIASLGFIYVGCGGGGGDSDPAEKVQLKKLSATWKIATTNGAMLDGVDRTADFTGLTLTITGVFNSASPKGPYDYTLAGKRPNPSPWPASGQWSFAESSADVKTTFVRTGNGETTSVTYSVTDTQLTTKFTISGAGFAGSRINKVEGNWEFTFTK